MALNDSSAIVALLKAYVKQPLEMELFSEAPLAAILSRHEDISGSHFDLPIVIGGGNTSVRFDDAQTYQSSLIARKFLVTMGDRFGFATVDGKALAQSRNDDGAYARLVTTALEVEEQNLANALATDLYRDGSGTLGYGPMTTGVITLVNPDDATFFEYDMVLQASATSGGAILQGASNLGYVIAVDYDLGTVTVSKTSGGAAGNPDGWDSGGSNSNYLLRVGDGAINSDNAMFGAQAWCPSTITAVPFFGVNRAINRVKLAGQYLDYSSNMSIEQAFVKAMNRRKLLGIKTTHCFTNFSSFYVLEKQMGGQRIRIEAEGEGSKLGFDGIEIVTPGGVVKVIPDRHCPAKEALFLDDAHAGLYSMRKAPRVIDDDGMEMLRAGKANAVEIRMGYFAQFASDQPVTLTRVLLPA